MVQHSRVSSLGRHLSMCLPTRVLLRILLANAASLFCFTVIFYHLLIEFLCNTQHFSISQLQMGCISGASSRQSPLSSVKWAVVMSNRNDLPRVSQETCDRRENEKPCLERVTIAFFLNSTYPNSSTKDISRLKNGKGVFPVLLEEFSQLNE